MAEQSTQIYVDLRPDAHEGVFDHEWAEKFLDRTRDTALAEHAFALCELWKSTSNAFRMPWFLLQSLNTFHDSVFGKHTAHSQKIVQALIHNLVSDKRLRLRTTQVRNLSKRLAELDAQITAELRNNPPKFDRAKVWRDFAESSEFALGVAGLREMCHSNLLFAYEHYWKSCLEVLPVTPSSSKKTTPTLIERFIDRFGQGLTDRVHDKQVALAREVRHAFVHNGGRVDRKLRDAGIDLPIGEKVPIPIELLRDLSVVLRERVDLITDHSLQILKASVPGSAR